MVHFKSSQHGFAAIEAVLIVVILAIIGGTGYYVYQAHSKSTDNLNQASLESQSALPHKKKETSEKSNQNYLTIKEWGVKLAVNNPVITGATYAAPKTLAGKVEWIRLGNAQLQNIFCEGIKEPVNYAGNLYRGTNLDEVLNHQAISSTNYVKIGSYYYTYQNNTGIGGCELSDKDLSIFRNVDKAYSANWQDTKVVAN